MTNPPSEIPPPEERVPEDIEERTEGRVLERSRRSEFADHVTAPVARRLRIDETAGWPMIIASGLALLWANIWPDTYSGFWTTELSIGVGSGSVATSLRDVVNDVLLPFFFLVIGMEVREELTLGHLASGARARLPLLAAIGGMAVPVAAYLAVTWGTPYAGAFGVPVATDIAFALALLMTLGSRVPGALKAFLLAFAAADDIGGVLVIAIFYGHGLSVPWLLAAIVIGALGVYLLHLLEPQVTWIYVAVGGALWVTLALAGVHTTVAGVVLGLMIPIRPLFAPSEIADRASTLVGRLESTPVDRRSRVLGRLEEVVARSESPADRSARVLTPAVSYGVLPIFGLAMAGTSMSADAWAMLAEHPSALGVLAGLLVGKPLGVFGLSWLGVRLGFASLPDGLDWRHVAGAAALSGIGFTVSLFIGRLAVGPEDFEAVKLAVLLSSTIAAVVGLAILGTAPSRKSASR